MVRPRWHLAHRDARLYLADEAETRAICPTVPYRFGGELALSLLPGESPRFGVLGMRSKKVWLILGVVALVAIALVSYRLLRPTRPQVMRHALTGYVLEVTPGMNRITVRNADMPGTMASMVMDYRVKTQPHSPESNRAMSSKQLWLWTTPIG